MMRLSVIIPGYNTPKESWERCVRSVVRAASIAVGDDFEVVCVDDGSSSKNRPQDAWFDDDRVAILRLEKNKGQSAARNCALDFAIGQYISFVDSDDEVVENVYKKSLEALVRSNDDIALFGARTVWCKEGMYKDNSMPGVCNLELADDKLMNVYDNCLFEYVWNKIYKRSFLDAHGIRFQEWMCPGEDTEFNLRCLSFSPRWSIIDYVGYVYYRNDGSSLSRYLPRYVESAQYKALAWRKTLPCKMAEWNDNIAVRVEWANMWRLHSPVSLVRRWKFARDNGLSFFSKLVLTIGRRFFYIRPLRRIRLRKMYREVKEWQ